MLTRNPNEALALFNEKWGFKIMARFDHSLTVVALIRPIRIPYIHQRFNLDAVALCNEMDPFLFFYPQFIIPFSF
jgi:hypothetical protein